MGNIYGVQQEGQRFGPLVIGADVTCPAATETNIFTTPTLIMPDPGNFFPLIWFHLCISLGATPPTACIFHSQINGGTNLNTITVPVQLLIANANIFFSGEIVNSDSPSLWISPGSTVSLSCNPTGQTVTVRASGMRAAIAMFRGIDSFT